MQYANECSGKIAAAFAEWQAAYAAFQSSFDAHPAASRRYEAMLPELATWGRPLSPDQIALADAARRLSGVEAAEEASDEACSKQQSLLLAFLALQPQTMSDVVLQAKCLKEWLHDCNLEHPAKVWLETITGEAWPDHDAAETEEPQRAAA